MIETEEQIKREREIILNSAIEAYRDMPEIWNKSEKVFIRTLNESIIYNQKLDRILNHLEYRLEHLKIAKSLRSRTHSALKGNTKHDRTFNLLGCTSQYFKIHLESQFKEGMSWENYGFRGWHIDHIRPCCSFDLRDPEEQKKCFHYTNLQPLWWKENISKGGRY